MFTGPDSRAHEELRGVDGATGEDNVLLAVDPFAAVRVDQLRPSEVDLPDKLHPNRLLLVE